MVIVVGELCVSHLFLGCLTLRNILTLLYEIIKQHTPTSPPSLTVGCCCLPVDVMMGSGGRGFGGGRGRGVGGGAGPPFRGGRGGGGVGLGGGGGGGRFGGRGMGRMENRPIEPIGPRDPRSLVSYIDVDAPKVLFFLLLLLMFFALRCVCVAFALRLRCVAFRCSAPNCTVPRSVSTCTAISQCGILYDGADCRKYFGLKQHRETLGGVPFFIHHREDNYFVSPVFISLKSVFELCDQANAGDIIIDDDKQNPAVSSEV